MWFYNETLVYVAVYPEIPITKLVADSNKEKLSGVGLLSLVKYIVTAVLIISTAKSMACGPIELFTSPFSGWNKIWRFSKLRGGVAWCMLYSNCEWLLIISEPIQKADGGANQEQSHKQQIIISITPSEWEVLYFVQLSYIDIFHMTFLINYSCCVQTLHF